MASVDLLASPEARFEHLSEDVAARSRQKTEQDSIDASLPQDFAAILDKMTPAQLAIAGRIVHNS